MKSAKFYFRLSPPVYSLSAVLIFAFLLLIPKNVYAQISISGTTNAADGVTVKVAINTTVDTAAPTTGSSSWTITGVAVSSGDIVTVFLSGQTNANEATGVTKYDGSGNISGMELTKLRSTVGSTDNATVTLTDMSLYDGSTNEDIVHEFNAGTLTIDSAASITNETLLILTSNTLTMASSETIATGNLTVNGTLTATGNATITCSGGSNTVTIAGLFNAGTSSFTETCTGAGCTTALTGAQTFYNLTLGANATGSFTLHDDITVNNTLTFSRQTGYNAGDATNTITVKGNVSITAAAIPGATFIVKMAGTSAQTITNSGGGRLGDLQISNTAAEVSAASWLTVGDDITVDASTTFDLAGFNLTGPNGDNVITNNGLIQLTGDEVVSSIETYTNNAGSTYEYTATSGSRSLTTFNTSFKSLKINGSGGTFSLAANTTVGENLTVAAGTFDVNDFTLSIDGNTTISGGQMLTGTNTVTFGDNGASDTVTISSGTLDIESNDTTVDIVDNFLTWTNSGGGIRYVSPTGVSTNLLSALSPYNDLTVGVATVASTYTFDGAIDVNGNLTVTSGTMATGSLNLNIGGNLDLNLAGDQIAEGTSIITFDGTADQNVNVTGSTDFASAQSSAKFNFTNSAGCVIFDDSTFVGYFIATTPGACIKCDASPDQIRASSGITIRGSAASKITINNDDGGATRTILHNNTGATVDAFFVNVNNSNANGSDIRCFGCTNGGNTDATDATPHWVFSPLRGSVMSVD